MIVSLPEPPIDGVDVTYIEKMGAYHAGLVGARDVNAERDRRVSRVPFAGHVYQCDADSLANIDRSCTLALSALMLEGAQANDLRWADAEADFVWFDVDNVAVPMDAQTMLAFGKRTTEWVRDHVNAARTLKDAATIPANYTDDSHWPT